MRNIENVTGKHTAEIVEFWGKNNNNGNMENQVNERMMQLSTSGKTKKKYIIVTYYLAPQLAEFALNTIDSTSEG